MEKENRRKKNNGLLNNNRGQSVAELALVLPIFLTIVMCIVEFGFLMGSYVTIINGAREGARYAVIGSDDATIRQKIRSVSPKLNVGQLNISIAPDENNRKSGEPVSVEVQYTASPIVPVFKNIIPQIYTVKSQMIMRVE